VQKLTAWCARAPNGIVGSPRNVARESAESMRGEHANSQVEIITGPVRLWHEGYRIESVLTSVRLAHLQACDLRNCVPFIGRFQAPVSR